MKTDTHGFGGQWVEIFSAGTHHDSNGQSHNIVNRFLDEVVENYDEAHHEAPLVIGHPKNDAPAYGWVKGLRVRLGEDGYTGVLEAQFADVDPAFERLVGEGKLKKRSASFYIDQKTAPGGRVPYLRHVGFLGAHPPAVKGLRDIQFDESIECVEFIESYPVATAPGTDKPESGEETMKDEEIKSFADKVAEKLKGIFKKEEPEPAKAGTLNFSEADLQKKITDAVTAATANFTEQLKQRDTKIAELQQSVAKQGSSAVHAENVAFVEKLGAAKCPPAFAKMGVVEFMDSLAGAGDKVTVISFSEEGGKKVETKTEQAPLEWFRTFLGSLGPFIQFGEQFSTLRATGTDPGAAVVDPKRMNELRQHTGLKVVEPAK